jgi:hypothetical protein
MQRERENKKNKKKQGGGFNMLVQVLYCRNFRLNGAQKREIKHKGSPHHFIHFI